MRHLNQTEPAVAIKWGDVLRMVEEAENEGDMSFDFPDLEEMLMGERAKPHIFPDWWLDSFPRWHEVKFAADYLTTRKVPAAVADAFDLRADTKEKRVCFPVRDFASRLLGFHGRAIEKDVDPRYRMYTQAKKNNPGIWLGEHYVDLEKPIVVVEGPFDVTSVYRVYRNVVSPLFSNPSIEKLTRMADALEWITLYDRGVGGDAGRAKVNKAIGKDHVVHHLQPPQGRKDPGDCTAPEIAGLLEGLVPLDPLLT
jgi:DNA primase